MRLVTFARNTPCALLLVAQLVGVLLYPFMEGSVAGRSAFGLFGLLVLALTVVAVRATPMLHWVAWVLAMPATVLLLVQVFTQDEGLAPYASVFEAALYFYAAFSMIRYMLADDRVTTDEMFAIGAVFTLLAWGYAHVFVVTQALDPGSFVAGDAEDVRTWMDLLFLSFTTLSSTGLSDIVPLTGHARSVVMLEQVTGLFYIAMVVTRLIALDTRRTAARR